MSSIYESTNYNLSYRGILTNNEFKLYTTNNSINVSSEISFDINADYKSSINYIFEIEDSFSEILKFDFIFLVILFTTGSKEAVDILTGYLLPAIWMMVIKITLMYDSLLKNDK